MDERADCTPVPEQETTVMTDDAAQTRLVGTERMPRPADAASPACEAALPQDDAPAAARIEALERRVRHDRIAIGALAVLVAALAIVVALMVTGTLSGVSVREPAAGTEAVAEREDSVDASVSDGVNEREDFETDAEDGDDGRVRAADLVSIVGQKWSNAKLMLEAMGIDEGDLVITTNDGGMVFDAGNWTVSTVTDLEDSGKVEVRLRHDIAW